MLKYFAALALAIGLTACDSDADTASVNISKAADNFEITGLRAALAIVEMETAKPAPMLCATFNGKRAPEGWYISSVRERLEEWRAPSDRWLVTLNLNSDIRTVAGVGATDRDAFFAAYAAAEPPHNIAEERS